MEIKQNKRTTGSKYEDIAADFLRGQEYTIIKMNFRCRIGEIDIVAKDKDTLVFVEVKYRKSRKYGYPEEAISAYKQRKIIKTAQFFMCRYGISDNVKCRFDIVAVEGDEIRLTKNAFTL